MNSLGDYLKNEIVTDMLKSSDDSMRENAGAAEKAGLEVRVTRTYDGVGLSGGRECQWCLDRCGENMTLQEAYAKGAFQRHPGCGCEIEYTSAKGVKTVQTRSGGRDSWVRRFDLERRKEYGTKKEPVTPGERIIASAVQQQLKVKGSSRLVDAIIDNHEALANISPVEMKTMLEIAGYKILPLGNDSKHYAGVPFESGGGYRIMLGGDGQLRYHPIGGIHKEAYWTVSNGKRGKHQYGMDGKERNYRECIAGIRK